MKYFKVEARRTAPRFEIAPANFSKVTGGCFPFEQQGERQGKFSQYGICPSCLNPIQLIGIARESKRTAYGKHAGKDIKGLPPWNYRKYEYCPFAAKNEKRKPCDDERLPQLDNEAIELYSLLITQIDRVVYILSKELNIQCSRAFWGNVFNQYVANDFYCYPWLTESNLPYMVAYRGIHHQRIYKQSFRVGSEIYKALAHYPGVAFEEINSNGYEQLSNQRGHYLELFFRFTDHKHKVVDGEVLLETMRFCIDDRKINKTVYEYIIEFNETYFMNLVQKTENEDKRQQHFLDIATMLPTVDEIIQKHQQHKSA